jgi:hypothetical protein
VSNAISRGPKKSDKLIAVIPAINVRIMSYDTARAAVTPALNALATLMLLSTMIAIAVGVIAYRSLTRGERAAKGSAFEGFASQL